MLNDPQWRQRALRLLKPHSAEIAGEIVLAAVNGALTSAILKQNGRLVAAARMSGAKVGGFGLCRAAVVVVSLLTREPSSTSATIIATTFGVSVLSR